MTTQLEGKKRQKLDYDELLQKKKAAIEKAHREYEELKLLVQLASEMTVVQAEIEKLTSLATLTKTIPSPEQQRAANSPAIVKSLAATDLPSMSSNGSDSSNNSLV